MDGQGKISWVPPFVKVKLCVTVRTQTIAFFKFRQSFWSDGILKLLPHLHFLILGIPVMIFQGGKTLLVIALEAMIFSGDPQNFLPGGPIGGNP
jgi:hypothetical protein